MERIRVKVALPDDQHMLQEIVEGAVELNSGSMVLVPPALPPHDVLLMQPARAERETLEKGGKVLAIDGRPGAVNLYELRPLGSAAGSSDLGDVIRDLVDSAEPRS